MATGTDLPSAITITKVNTCDAATITVVTTAITVNVVVTADAAIDTAVTRPHCHCHCGRLLHHSQPWSTPPTLPPSQRSSLPTIPLSPRSQPL